MRLLPLDRFQASDFIEQNLHAILRKAGIETRVYGKDLLPMGGEYTGAVVMQGIRKFIELSAPRLIAARAAVRCAFRRNIARWPTGLRRFAN
jgi:TPP-dependent indolepyruvate ferredoxin oxidoreductase alpha subunit